ncbi:MAG: lipopolysaccharide heptosyltransferase II [Candidatus Omnitrophica bacterium]|nr:lipopolysaccharide heptosyltransferase II [Candidatus Omnitrophota bacterium]
MKISKILFITLTNIGDVFLSLPALDYLRARFPGSEITVMLGERPKEIFENNPNINRVIVYNKQAKLKEKIKLFRGLDQEKFDLVVDLRNSLFGFLLRAKYKTSLFLSLPQGLKHMSQRHLYRLPKEIKGSQDSPGARTLYISPSDERYISDALKQNGIIQEDKTIVISAGARSHIKRWPSDKFVELIPALVGEFNVKVILVGDKEDLAINKYIRERLKCPVADLTAKTTLTQLACLLESASLLVTNDSAVLHLASYLDIPIVSIFGPTDEAKYGPWSQLSRIVKRDISCRPCQKAQCCFNTLNCLRLIKVNDVLRRVQEILILPRPSSLVPQRSDFKRILIVRTDRIGDVLLSTPVIKALRENYPDAYIAMMVSPYAKDIIDGNPYLDEVIIYDKSGKHKSWMGSIKFTLNLRKRRFDLSLILHPINRVHLVTFFAGIPKRVGYDRKLGFLLTDKPKHTKQLGEKHELEYNLDLLRYLGIEAGDKNLFMPIKIESEQWVEGLFKQEGLKTTDKILTIHPGASCPSKIWPSERFAQVADKLAQDHGFKILLIAGPRDIALADNVIKHMRHPAINLAGKTSVSQLASLLKRCKLFISNDSGPVHIASAVGTPVISIFGRSQLGLSPKRWGPLGKKDRVLHKEVGCIKCLAHNCVKEFACLKAITVEDVLQAAEEILKS